MKHRCFVLFLGADGTGKSSLVAAIDRELSIEHSKIYLGMGNDGWLLPPVKWLSKHGGSRPGSSLWLRKIFWSCAFPLELTLRRLKCMLRGYQEVVLIDRFPGVPFLSNKYMHQFYLAILPRPDIIITLVGRPEIIAGRKPEETTPERVLRDTEKWRNVAQRLNANKSIEIDSTVKDIYECTRQVIAVIYADRDIDDKVVGGSN